MKQLSNLPTCLFPGLITLMVAFSLPTIKAGPNPSSFGVWDRGEAMDPKLYPFLKGTTCDAPWNSVEKSQGVYDWSFMDQCIEKASKDKTSLYFGFEAGPETPDWVYEKGVPKVTTDDNSKEKFHHYPFYLSTEYKTYYHLFLTEIANHIGTYTKE